MSHFRKLYTILLLMLVFVTAAEGRERGESIKILAIGNSFSVDAVEQYLYDIAAADGVELLIGNLYIGGCTLERHARNAHENLAAYSYRKIVDGVYTKHENTTLETALRDEEWDIITMQQASGLSGRYDTYMPHLDFMIGYVRGIAGAEPQILFHQTWAYGEGTDYHLFANYDRDQMKMYNAICDCCRKVELLEGIAGMIPSGTAVQNARTSSLGRDLTRDGFHLDKGIGRYIAACTWYERISGRNVVRNKFRPQNIPDRQGVIARRAAHKAVKRNFRITSLAEY